MIFYFFGSLLSQSPEPDTICSKADIFCNANDFKGPWTLPNIEMSPTPDYYICDQPTENTGRPQNILFFGFVPFSNYVEFDIIINSMTPQVGKDTGYQYGVVDRCIEDKDVEYIVCNGDKVTDPVSTIKSSNFIPGHTYYLYIDGYTGCIVDFEIDLIEGLGGYQVDEIDGFVAIDRVGDIIEVAKNDTVTLCSGATFDFRSKNILNTDTYTWLYNGDVLSSKDTFLSAAFAPLQDVVKICHQGVTDCDSSELACFYVKVDTLPVVRIDTTICASELIWGYTPPQWECDVIKTQTLVKCNSTDTITGCTFTIEANVHEGEEPIVQVDSVHCGAYEMKNDTIIRDSTLTQYGCDSIIDVSHYYFNFDGHIDTFMCNDGQFELNIVYGTDLSVYQKYEVVWYLDGVEIPNSNSFVLGNVNNQGKYSATVKLSKSNSLDETMECTADVGEYDVVSIPNTSFSLNADTVCVSDSCVLLLDNYDEGYNYKIEVLSSKGDVKDLGGGAYQVTWSDFVGLDSLFVRLDEDCPVETKKAVYVMPKVMKPVISCKEQTGSSVEFEWETSDCVEEFDVWIDGNYMGTQSEKSYKVEGLAYGQTVKIQIETKNANCVCGSEITIDSCTALECPNVSVSIDNLPDEICYGDLDSELKIDYSTDTSGVVTWVGDIIDSEGVILRDNISSTQGGMFYVTLNFSVGDCDYKAKDSINIMPEVDARINVKDISCYDMTDGELFVEPVSGKDDFILELNGEEQSSMQVMNLDEGYYSLVLTDANGCQYSSSFDIVKPQTPQISFEGTEIIEPNSENYYSIDIEDYDSIAWFKNDTFLNIFSNHLDISSNQDFELCYTVFFDTICEMSDCKRVRINREDDLFMPNIFSPNSDGTNDYIFPISKSGIPYHINVYRIFDRWGEQVYEKSDFYIGGEIVPNIGWNGLFKNKQVPQGVYVYYIEILGEGGEITKKYGDITLIR